jgi:hypothetical protein
MAGFCYFFMLEAFSPGFSWKDALGHFAQGTLMLAIALVAWMWGIVGGCIYIALGIYILLKWRRTRFTLTLIGMLVAVGLLFIFL